MKDYVNPIFKPVHEYPMSHAEIMEMSNAFDISFNISKKTVPNIRVEVIDFFGRLSEARDGYMTISIPMDTWSADVLNWQLARYLAATHFADASVFSLVVATLITPTGLLIENLENFISCRIKQLGLPGGVALECLDKNVRLISLIPASRWESEVYIYNDFCKLTAKVMTMLAKATDNETLFDIKCDYFSDLENMFKWGSDFTRWKTKNDPLRSKWGEVADAENNS